MFLRLILRILCTNLSFAAFGPPPFPLIQSPITQEIESQTPKPLSQTALQKTKERTQLTKVKNKKRQKPIPYKTRISSSESIFLIKAKKCMKRVHSRAARRNSVFFCEFSSFLFWILFYQTVCFISGLI